jgi:hypothetical protein
MKLILFIGMFVKNYFSPGEKPWAQEQCDPFD